MVAPKGSSNIFSKVFSKFKATKIGGVIRAPYLRKVSQAATLSDPSVNRTNEDLTTLRQSATQKETIKALVENSPDVSMAAASLARFAITDSYTVIARSLEGKIDPTATVTANMVARRMDKLQSNYTGYSPPSDFRSLSERAIKCFLISGNCGSELVLSQGQVPERISVFSTRKVKMENRPNGTVVPYLTDGDGNTIYIDTPLAVIQDMDQDVESAYSSSPLTAAIQAVLTDLDFANMLRRAFGKANLPRVSATIDHEKWMAGLPPDIKLDKDRLKSEMAEVVSGIQDELNGLQPEDALVTFDIVKVDHMTAGNNSADRAAAEQRHMINARVSTGTRTLPSILGRGENSSTASVEAMMYLRTAEGMQEKLNQMFSTHLTTACRLLGHDVYVDFVYAAPELRPKSELESFRTMKQAIALEQLSYGFTSDEETSITITGTLPSGNYTPLSGTGFYTTKAAPADNPFSNTSVSGQGVNDTQAGKEQKAKNQKPASNKSTGK